MFRRWVACIADTLIHGWRPSHDTSVFTGNEPASFVRCTFSGNIQPFNVTGIVESASGALLFSSLQFHVADLRTSQCAIYRCHAWNTEMQPARCSHHLHLASDGGRGMKRLARSEPCVLYLLILACWQCSHPLAQLVQDTSSFRLVYQQLQPSCYPAVFACDRVNSHPDQGNLTSV
jgi:hypothetical protein